MFDQKKENSAAPGATSKENSEIIDEKNVSIHTMQEDLDALSGIFPKKETESRETTSAKKEILEKKQSAQPEQYFNPFLDKQATLTPDKQEKIADFAQKNNIPSIPHSPVPVKNPTIPGGNKNTPVMQVAPKSKSHIFIWIIAILLIVAAFSFGGYYFWMMRKTPVADVPAVQQPGGNAPEQGIPSQNVVVEPIPKYLVDKPNYLSLSIENPTYDDFKKTVTTVASELKAAGITAPVEFILTNNKNEQIGFVEFLLISKIELPSDVLKNIGNTFSLFIQESSEGTRLGLSAETLDATVGAAAMRKGEAAIVKGLSSLFLDDVAVPAGAKIFKNNKYRNVDIRYFNLIGNGSKAIDYAFRGTELLISTSKASMLAIIDKLEITLNE